MSKSSELGLSGPLGAEPEHQVYSVSELNRAVRSLLEGEFPLLWVEGELSNLSRPGSGHLYFSLKDTEAQVRCALFRNRALLLTVNPENGMQVRVRARVSLFEPRGDYQLIAEHLEEAGDGALRRAFDLLKQKLAAEGLFDPARKRPLPAFPQRIGVITSPTGAALRDIITTLRRRFPALPVLIYPVPVQGAGAGAQIAQALRLAGERRECDVLILARGGGSLEDLWAFNEEVVARAIAMSPIPVVTGIGHEIDFTIADFVADHRAPTPTGAAELVSPNADEWQNQIARMESRLTYLWRQQHQRRQQHTQWLLKRLEQRHPGQQLRQHAQRLDELEQRLRHACKQRLHHNHMRLASLTAGLHRHIPVHRIEQLAVHMENHRQRLLAAQRLTLERGRQRLTGVSRALEAVSPLATLGRGYAIVQRTDGQILRRAGEVNIGERIEARLSEGRLVCTVDESLDS